jgi:hypothetical protein
VPIDGRDRDEQLLDGDLAVDVARSGQRRDVRDGSRMKAVVALGCLS